MAQVRAALTTLEVENYVRSNVKECIRAGERVRVERNDEAAGGEEPRAVLRMASYERTRHFLTF